MKSWKKGHKSTAALMMAFMILICLELLAEERFGYMVEKLVSMDTSAILERVPEIEVTEADKALLEELSQCAAVQRLSGGGEISALEDSQVSAAVRSCLSGEKADSAFVSVYVAENKEILRLQ